MSFYRYDCATCNERFTSGRSLHQHICSGARRQPALATISAIGGCFKMIEIAPADDAGSVFDSLHSEVVRIGDILR